MNDSVERLAYRVEDAVKATGVPRSTLYDEMRAGRLSSVKLGSRRLIPADSLRSWLASLQPEQSCHR